MKRKIASCGDVINTHIHINNKILLKKANNMLGVNMGGYLVTGGPLFSSSLISNNLHMSTHHRICGIVSLIFASFLSLSTFVFKKPYTAQIYVDPKISSAPKILEKVDFTTQCGIYNKWTSIREELCPIPTLILSKTFFELTPQDEWDIDYEVSRKIKRKQEEIDWQIKIEIENEERVKGIDLTKQCFIGNQWLPRDELCPMPTFDAPINELHWLTKQEEIARHFEDQIQREEKKWIEREERKEREMREWKEQQAKNMEEIDFQHEMQEIEYQQLKEQRQREHQERLNAIFYKMMRDFYGIPVGEDTKPIFTPSENCSRLTRSHYKEKNHFDRVLDPSLDPHCPEHAMVILSPGFNETAYNLDKCTYVNKLKNQVSKHTHPDKNPDKMQQANDATAKINEAAGFLCQI